MTIRTYAPGALRRVVGAGMVWGLVLLYGGFGAAGAERCVLVEDFTATWCGPCHTVSTWLAEMQELYPATFALLQEHVSSTDAYAIAWGKSRFLSYGNASSIPNVWFDGTIQVLGTNPGYDGYYAAYATRAALPTDVTVELGAEQIEGPTFRFKVRVGLESGGQPKTVRVYLVRALDRYPNPANAYDRNCLMEAAPTADVALSPGHKQTIEWVMTFDPASWTRQPDIRAFAWAQVPGDTGPRNVYQSVRAAWPLTPLPPDLTPGDLNCDAEVDFDDINAFVLALSNPPGYLEFYPGCNIMNADINGDGVVDFGDINPFVTLLSGPPPGGASTTAFVHVRAEVLRRLGMASH